MDIRVVYSVISIFCILIEISIAARHFITESCGHVIGPDFGTYLEFDAEATYDKKTKELTTPQHIKGHEFECIIVLRGMPSTGEKRYMSLYWRDFILAGPNLTTVENDVTNCGKAFVTVYNGMDTTAQEKYTLCGVGALPSHLEWEGEYITLYFYIDFRNPNLKIVSTTTTTEPPGGTTLSGDNTTMTTEEQPTTTPVEDTFPYPDVYFRIDVTSFDYECNDSIPGVVMKCNDSKRCIDDSLRCDFWFSRNCQNELFPLDNTDTSRHPPGNCYRKTTPTTTTTTPAPPAPPPDLRPLYGTLGTLFGLLFLFWCCWRPGYLPWRLARLRNVACFNACGRCCPYGCCAACFDCCSRCSPCCMNCSASPCARCSPCCKACSESSPCARCCPGGSGPSATKGAAWREAKMRGLLDSRGSMVSDLSPGAFGGPFALNGGPKKKRSSVGPLPLFPQSAPYKVAGPGNTPTAGGRSNVKPVKRFDPNDPAHLDAVELANGWTRFLTNDGLHLREHR